MLGAEGEPCSGTQFALEIGPGPIGADRAGVPVGVVAVVGVEHRLVGVVGLGGDRPGGTGSVRSRSTPIEVPPVVPSERDLSTPTTSPRARSTTGPPDRPGYIRSPSSRICSSSSAQSPKVPITWHRPLNRVSCPDPPSVQPV